MNSNLTLGSEYGSNAELRKWCLAFLCREITIALEIRSHSLMDEYLMSALPTHLPQASPSAANALLEPIGVE
jgi:hypothetical protein